MHGGAAGGSRPRRGAGSGRRFVRELRCLVLTEGCAERVFLIKGAEKSQYDEGALRFTPRCLDDREQHERARLLDEGLAGLEPERVVPRRDEDGRPADRGSSQEPGPLPGESKVVGHRDDFALSLSESRAFPFEMNRSSPRG